MNNFQLMTEEENLAVDGGVVGIVIGVVGLVIAGYSLTRGIVKDMGKADALRGK
jgi:hypothetical protein